MLQKTALFLERQLQKMQAEKIKQVLGFVPAHSIEDAVGDLVGAFRAGKIPDSMNDARYYNIKLMQGVKLR